MTDKIEKKLAEWERKSRKAIDTIPGSRVENPAKIMLLFILALRRYREANEQCLKCAHPNSDWHPDYLRGAERDVEKLLLGESE